MVELTQEQMDQVFSELRARITDGRVCFADAQLHAIADRSITVLERSRWLILREQKGYVIGAAVVFFAATIGLGYAASWKGASDKFKEAGVTSMMNTMRQGVGLANELKRGDSAVPVGSILAWHQNYDLDDPSKELNQPPDGWVKCNGQVLEDKDKYKNSPFLGKRIPNLNDPEKVNFIGDGEGGAFLRGGTRSEERYRMTAGALQNMKMHDYNGKYGKVLQRFLRDDGTIVDPRHIVYTSPVSMSVVRIMRVK